MSARVEACESEGVHVVCMWYACMWCACGMHVVCMHVVCMWHVCGMHVVCMWYACMWYACMWYACMWEVAREAQGSLAAVGGLDGGRERTERLLLQLFI